MGAAIDARIPPESPEGVAERLQAHLDALRSMLAERMADVAGPVIATAQAGRADLERAIREVEESVSEARGYIRSLVATGGQEAYQGLREAIRELQLRMYALGGAIMRASDSTVAQLMGPLWDAVRRAGAIDSWTEFHIRPVLTYRLERIAQRAQPQGDMIWSLIESMATEVRRHSQRAANIIRDEIRRTVQTAAANQRAIQQAILAVLGREVFMQSMPPDFFAAHWRVSANLAYLGYRVVAESINTNLRHAVARIAFSLYFRVIPSILWLRTYVDTRIFELEQRILDPIQFMVRVLNLPEDRFQVFRELVYDVTVRMFPIPEEWKQAGEPLF